MVCERCGKTQNPSELRRLRRAGDYNETYYVCKDTAACSGAEERMRKIFVIDELHGKEYLCLTDGELQKTVGKLLAEEISHIVIVDEQKGKRWTIMEEVL